VATEIQRIQDSYSRDAFAIVSTGHTWHSVRSDTWRGAAILRLNV
jgi:hypothetical protein